jgi:hypothetical protein
MLKKNLNDLKTSAHKLGVTYDFLKAAIESGHIKTIAIGRRQFVSNAEIARFVSSVSVAA